PPSPSAFRLPARRLPSDRRRRRARIRRPSPSLRICCDGDDSRWPKPLNQRPKSYAPRRRRPTKAIPTNCDAKEDRWCCAGFVSTAGSITVEYRRCAPVDFGAAVRGGGEQFERAAPVGLGATAVTVGRGMEVAAVGVLGGRQDTTPSPLEACWCAKSPAALSALPASVTPRPRRPWPAQEMPVSSARAKEGDEIVGDVIDVRRVAPFELP